MKDASRTNEVEKDRGGKNEGRVKGGLRLKNGDLNPISQREGGIAGKYHVEIAAPSTEAWHLHPDRFGLIQVPVNTKRTLSEHAS